MKKRIFTLILITAFLLVMFVPSFASAAVDNSLLVNNNFIKGWCLNPQQPVNDSFSNNWRHTVRPADGINLIDLADTVFYNLTSSSPLQNYFYIYYYNYHSESLDIYRFVTSAFQGSEVTYNYTFSLTGRGSYPQYTISANGSNCLVYKLSLPYTAQDVTEDWTFTLYNNASALNLTLYYNNIFGVYSVRSEAPIFAEYDNFLPLAWNLDGSRIAPGTLIFPLRTSFDFEGDYIPLSFEFRCNNSRSFEGAYSYDHEHIANLLSHNFIYIQSSSLSYVKSVAISPGFTSGDYVSFNLYFSGLGFTGDTLVFVVFNGFVINDFSGKTVFYGGDGGNYDPSKITSITDVLDKSLVTVTDLRFFISDVIGSFPDFIVFMVFAPLSIVLALGVFGIVKRLVF